MLSVHVAFLLLCAFLTLVMSKADLELDPLTRGRRIVLQSKDGHALWVSSAVLSTLGPVPSNVEGGVVMRDTTGNPTGAYFPAHHVPLA